MRKRRESGENKNLSYTESIAEAFGEWYNSDTPREFCEALLKEVGVI